MRNLTNRENSKCAFPTSGGQDYISQELTNLCPKAQYTLT